MSDLILPGNPTYTDITEAIHKCPRGQPIIVDLKKVSRNVLPKVLHLVHRYTYTFNKYVTNKYLTKSKGQDKSHRFPESSSGTVEDINVVIKGFDGYMYRQLVLKELQKQAYIARIRDIINEPANIATPEHMVDWTQRLFHNQPNTSITIYNEERLKKEGFNLVLAVGQGSVNRPYMVVVDYAPPKYDTTICLCGKGVTFDSGGLQIKPRNGDAMVNMKADKTGGCISLGVVKYLADMKIPCRLVAIVPFVENSVSGSSTRPSDIIKSYSGKTVEIRNTDAEGRLILADALAFAARYQPDYIMDHATLTSWSQSLHCDTSAVFFSMDKALHDMIAEIGENVGERTLGMPRWIEYMRYCTSKVADLNNILFTIHGCNAGDGFMATMFMAHFVPPKVLNRWIHFDICNSCDAQLMNANSMNLTIELIKKIVTSGKKKNDPRGSR